MKNIEELTQEITDLTTTIETQHPELYQFLIETPIAKSNKPDGEVKREDLEKYLQTLNIMLKRYEETRSLI